MNVSKPALFRTLVVPVELGLLMDDRCPVTRQEARSLGAHGNDLLVVRKLDGARLPQERGRVRGEEHLAVADADHERHAVLAGSDEEPGVIVVDGDEREVAFELGECETDGLDEVAVVEALDEVRDRLGVGLGRERVAVGDEVLRQLAIVLDDPVEDDRDLRRVTTGERVRVGLGDSAVGRPARVGDAGGRLRSVRRARSLRLPERPDGTHVVEPVRLEKRDPGRVVAAVLEALEAL
jgi:hypothetical protein